MHKFQWNFNQNSSIFIPENALENAVCEMASILSPPQCVKDIFILLKYLLDSLFHVHIRLDVAAVEL